MRRRPARFERWHRYAHPLPRRKARVARDGERELGHAARKEQATRRLQLVLSHCPRALSPLHLGLQAVVAGAAALWLLNPGELGELKGLLLFSLILETPFVLLDVHGRHSTEAARRAAHSILEGRRARIYWVGVLGLGKLVPLLWISFLDTGSGLAVIPALLALLGIALWEHLWVEAPQRLPLA